ncbi:DNA sulfur modification protein DndD [Blastomonas sp.]|uniref:DNA sulfur modification protein DndD n=1 Tax=Blastomonas sp. TaxID=1909299 RepID=UPI00406A8B3A
MIFDEFVLHDFGIYGGRQAVNLTPEPDRPIVLFGGLNGGGKTTLLDGLQLCLYGHMAQASNRGSLAYDEYLRRSVHRGADRAESGLELALRHRGGDREQHFRLIRTWSTSQSAVRERFEVLRDGVPDTLATEHWAEQVEEVMPARIAPLFLFDGEKIEAYADLAGASALIGIAIQNLLGLDVIERLIGDLSLLERRKRKGVKATSDRSALAGVRASLARTTTERLAYVQERSSTLNQIDRAREAVAQAEAAYRREGGALFEARAENEAAVERARAQLAATQREQRDAAAGAAPLLLVRDLLARVALRDAQEEETRRSQETLAALEAEFELLAELPAARELPAKARKAIFGHLEARLAQRTEMATRPILVDLARDARDALTAANEAELPGATFALRRLEGEENKARRKLDEAEAALAATPTADALADVARSLAAAKAALAGHESAKRDFDTAIARLDREIMYLENEERRLLADEASQLLAQDDTARMVRHSERSRATLAAFRLKVAERHVHRIETLVLECFGRLSRKSGLIRGFRIDPASFAIALEGADGRALTPERLSAGERQLFAVAILWGLARASGRPLPMVIDTPLGRLDSKHRSQLIQHYFPQASHQLVLLSTDEEISGRYLREIERWVARTYHLRYDPIRQSTVIELGYPEEQARVA